jgi:hypothetical protein
VKGSRVSEMSSFEEHFTQLLPTAPTRTLNSFRVLTSSQNNVKLHLCYHVVKYTTGLRGMK